MQDLYRILGIEPDASADEVRAAYRALAQRFHPDHNPEDLAAERRMQEINEAFAVLNSPEHRLLYDQQRLAALTEPAATGMPPSRGAGRGARPYSGRGHNWGLHNGATEPPAYIVRADPGGFNLVSMQPGDCPSRDVRIWGDAPFPVQMTVQSAPWLHVSTTHVTLQCGGFETLNICISQDASETLHGWRDGSVSLATDDPRVYCPDVRITGIFLAPAENTAPHAPLYDNAAPEPPDDLRAEPESSSPFGWLRRLFGG